MHINLINLLNSPVPGLRGQAAPAASAASISIRRSLPGGCHGGGSNDSGRLSAIMRPGVIDKPISPFGRVTCSTETDCVRVLDVINSLVRTDLAHPCADAANFASWSG